MSTKDDKPDEFPEPEKSVGYGAPPEATRFKKGVSGNPKGRPRGSLNVATVFTKILRERVVINEHGQRHGQLGPDHYGGSGCLGAIRHRYHPVVEHRNHRH